MKITFSNFFLFNVCSIAKYWTPSQSFSKDFSSIFLDEFNADLGELDELLFWKCNCYLKYVIAVPANSFW